MDYCNSKYKVVGVMIDICLKYCRNTKVFRDGWMGGSKISERLPGRADA